MSTFSSLELAGSNDDYWGCSYSLGAADIGSDACILGYMAYATFVLPWIGSLNAPGVDVCCSRSVLVACGDGVSSTIVLVLLSLNSNLLMIIQIQSNNQITSYLQLLSNSNRAYIAAQLQSGGH